MTDPFNSYYNGKVLELDSMDNQNATESFQSHKLSDTYQDMIVTTAHEDVRDTRSRKQCAHQFESSFENNYLHQHVEASMKKLQNFIEAIADCSKLIQKDDVRDKIYRYKASFETCCIQIINMEQCPISKDQKNSFKKDLAYEKKLKDYLDHIAVTYATQVACELIAIANYIWEQYIKVADLQFDQEELKSWAQNLSESKFDQYKNIFQKTRDLCFQADISEAFPNFDVALKEYMKFFFITIALTIQQYFENPFFNRQVQKITSFKRISSDSDLYSEDQFSQLEDSYLSGSKKIKY